MLYVINLDTDVQRMSTLSKSLIVDDISFERFSAFDARYLTKTDLQDFFYKRFKVNLSDKVSAAQAGCFISQFSVWEKIANGEESYGIVFEDDIHFSRDLKGFLTTTEWMPDDFDIIRFETSTNRLRLSKDNIIRFNGRNIHTLESTSWCAGAYVMSKACAKKIISHKLEKYISADAFLFSFEKSDLANQLKIYQVSPALAIQDKYIQQQDKVGFESNIETDSTLKRVFWILKTYLTSISIFSMIKKSILGYKRVEFK